MNWVFSLYAVPTFLAGLISAVLTGLAWRHRSEPMGVSFAVLMAGLCVWSFGYGVELIVASLPAMLFWDKVAFVGSVVVPTAWLVLAVEYAGYEERLTRRAVVLLAVEPLVTLTLVWTNEFHGFIWRDAALGPSGSTLAPSLTFGWAYWANFAYSYLLLGVGVALLLWVAVRSTRIYRRQSAVLVVGALVPLGANAAFNLAPSFVPAQVDLTTFAFAVSGVFFALALFRYRMLDLVPVARDAVFEELEDGLVVVDTDGRIVDRNPAARRILGSAREGKRLEETPLGDPGDSAAELVTVEVGGTARTYDIRSATLRDFRGRNVGQLLAMRDVTELKIVRRHEQRLNVLNRVLRHNVRNDMNVVIGYADTLAEQLTGRRREHVETIRDVASKTVSTSEKARYAEVTLASRHENRNPVDVSDASRRAASDVAERFPAADVSVDAPENARGIAAGRGLLETAVANVVENAVEHNTGANPRVEVRVERDAERVLVRIADDGPGIPEMERAALLAGRETALEHGSGLGLWLVQWIVEASGGSLRFEENRPTGSVVSIELRRPAETDATADAEASIE